MGQQDLQRAQVAWDKLTPLSQGALGFMSLSPELMVQRLASTGNWVTLSRGLLESSRGLQNALLSLHFAFILLSNFILQWFVFIK